MFNRQKQREATQGIFISSIKGLANTAAVAATFFTVPVVFSHTVDWVAIFTAHHYDAELAGPAGLAWFVIVTLLVFFIARASIATTLVMGGIAIAIRFL